MNKIIYTLSILFLFSYIESQVVITPTEYTHALRNPLKGLRWGFKNQQWGSNFPNNNHPYVSCGKWYIGWNLIENNNSDDINKIRDYCNNLWENIPNENNKIIPRVYIAWPDNEKRWPSDMTEGDFTSEQFKIRIKRLIKRLGTVWDSDPRVGYVV